MATCFTAPRRWRNKYLQVNQPHKPMAQFLKTTTVADGPTQLSAVPLNYHNASIIAQKGLDGTANAGTVKLGYSASASEQPLELEPGDERTFRAPAHGRGDLSQLYLTVANDDDGVVVVYT